MKIPLYTTPEHDCPYLPDKQAKTLFLTPEVQANKSVYQALIANGFRRSGDHIYRPHCETCNACISVRLPVKLFKPNKQQRRCFKKGQRFTTQNRPAVYDDEHYQLFERYLSIRHRDGDMYPTSPAQFKEFVLCDWLETQFLDFYDPLTSMLIATSVYDILDDGLSAVYTFFDPDYHKFSPGRLALLQLIEQAKIAEMPFVYLGYWIKNCQKMSYKGEYRPSECFVNNQWILLN